MITRFRLRGSLMAAAIAGAWLMPHAAGAVTMQECSKLYKAAQDDGSIGTMKWQDFRKAKCGDAAAAGPAKPEPTAAARPAAPAAAAAKPATPPAKPMTTSKAEFPSAVASKYSKESAGKARLHTCLDQYNANKATNANAGLKWIEKGGGYYSQCNTHLKG
jgi:hypothetical protein